VYVAEVSRLLKLRVGLVEEREIGFGRGKGVYI
jgi:hypothetical protein